MFSGVNLFTKKKKDKKVYSDVSKCSKSGEALAMGGLVRGIWR